METGCFHLPISKVLSPFPPPKKSNQISHHSWKAFGHSPSHCGHVHLPGYTLHISSQSEDEVRNCTAHGPTVSIYHLVLCETERNWVLDSLAQFLNVDTPRSVTGVFPAAQGPITEDSKMLRCLMSHGALEV